MTPYNARIPQAAGGGGGGCGGGGATRRAAARKRRAVQGKGGDVRRVRGREDRNDRAPPALALHACCVV